MKEEEVINKKLENLNQRLTDAEDEILALEHKRIGFDNFTRPLKILICILWFVAGLVVLSILVGFIQGLMIY